MGRCKEVSKLLSTALSYHSVDGLSGGTHGAIRSLDKRLELVKFTKNTIDSLVDKVRHKSIATHRCTSDLKPLVSRYSMKCCIGGKPVLRCGVVVPKAKEYILARSRSSQRKSYVSILLANGVDGSNNIVRVTKNVSVVRDEENGNRGMEARGSTDATRLSEVEESSDCSYWHLGVLHRA